MKQVIAVGAVMLCLISALAQVDKQGLTKKPHVLVSAPAGPVTEAEAAATFDRVVGLYKSVLNISVPSSKTHGSPNAPISRAEVIETLLKFYKAASPDFKITLTRVPADMSRLKVDKPSLKPGLVMLIEKGCVGKYGPLSVGTKTSLSVHDFGDSLGFFLSRIAEMTHTPSVKWTPYLRDKKAPI